MLKILYTTEEVQLERTTKSNKRKRAFPKMFMSTTTLKAWRVTIRSAIALTEELLNEGYTTVLTGKWNQDQLEVI